MHYRISFIFVTFICLFCFAATGFTQNTNTDEDSKPVILYSGTPKKYEIADIKVEGVKNYEDYVLIGLSGLSVGQTITVPGDEITGAIKRYWKHGLFSNVQITAEKIEGNKIWLKISLTQRPRIADVRYHGVKKSERTDLESKLGMVKGMQITPNTVDRAKTLIKRYFDDKGFKNAEVIIAQKDDPSNENQVIVDIDIDKKDDAYAPRTYGSLMGIRMPDGIAAFQVDGKTYLVTANEGDAREWGDEDLGTFYLSEDEQDFGEEGVTSPTGAITGENSGLEGKVVFFKVEDFDGLDSGKDYLFGGRTFTIYEAGENGVTEVFTSGNDFETLTARYLTDYYNCSNDNTVVDDRSGKKGPEAESVTVGTVDGRTYAFVALERTGGVMVYDVTEPASAQYVNYINTRDFASIVEGSEEYEDGELDKWVTGGDVAPEGLLFLSDAVSPTGEALLLAACEVSGTVAVYQVGGEPLSVLPFTDVEARDAQAVRYVCENGLMAGVSADRFEPNGTLTRGEAVTALWALEGRPVVNYLMDFSDVDPAASYGEAVRWAASEGIAGGYGGGLFGPDDPITREQLAVMLYRYARHEGYDTAQGGMAVREFADYDQIAGYAAEAMTWAVEAGVLTATSLDTLAPGQAATRVQTAQALLALSQFTK